MHIPESQMDPLMPTACATRSAVGYSLMVVVCSILDAEQSGCLLFGGGVVRFFIIGSGVQGAGVDKELLLVTYVCCMRRRGFGCPIFRRAEDLVADTDWGQKTGMMIFLS